MSPKDIILLLNNDNLKGLARGIQTTYDVNLVWWKTILNQPIPEKTPKLLSQFIWDNFNHTQTVVLSPFIDNPSLMQQNTDATLVYTVALNLMVEAELDST